MEDIYREIIVPVEGQNGRTVEYNIPVSNISYYREYVETSSNMGDKGSIQTMIYIKGATKSIKAKLPKDQVKKLIGEQYLR